MKLKMKTGFPEKVKCFTNESNITVVDSNNFTTKDTKLTSSQAYFEKSSKNFTKSKPTEKFGVKDAPSCDIREWHKRQSNTAQQDKRKTSAAKHKFGSSIFDSKNLNAQNRFSQPQIEKYEQNQSSNLASRQNLKKSGGMNSIILNPLSPKTHNLY